MPTSPTPSQLGTILAFDFGEKRIGVAVGDWYLKIAHPLTVILVPLQGMQGTLSLLEPLIREWLPDQFIVGLPRYVDGNEHRLTSLCQDFAERLEAHFARPVILVDERFTSRIADQQLAALEIKAATRKKKGLRDQVAAQLILQQYFDQSEYAAQS